MSKIKNKLLQLAENKQISKREFCRQIGVSHTYLNDDAEVGSDKLEGIVSVFPEISLDWLVTGNGPMLRDERPAPVVSPPDLERENMALKEVIAEKNTEIRQLNREIGSLEEKLGARGQGASPRFYSTRKSDESNVPDVSGTHDNPHVTPAIPPKRDGRQTARK